MQKNILGGYWALKKCFWALKNMILVKKKTRFLM